MSFFCNPECAAFSHGDHYSLLHDLGFFVKIVIPNPVSERAHSSARE